MHIMQLTDLVHRLMLVVVVQLLGDTVGDMTPFLRRALQPSLPQSATPGVMLQLPSRDANILRLKPRKKHLKTQKLLRRLKSEYNTKYMSIRRPSRQEEVTARSLDEDVLRAAMAVNISLVDSDGVTMVLNASVIDAMKSWMARQGSCPVHYNWKDMGSFFWPRWIKLGRCGSEQSCSWPPGMHCIPAKVKRVKILRWHCRAWGTLRGRGRRLSKKGGGKKDESNDTETWIKRRRGRRVKLSRRCKWIVVPYPITDGCFCSC